MEHAARRRTATDVVYGIELRRLRQRRFAGCESHRAEQFEHAHERRVVERLTAKNHHAVYRYKPDQRGSVRRAQCTQIESASSLDRINR